MVNAGALWAFLSDFFFLVASIAFFLGSLTWDASRYLLWVGILSLAAYVSCRRREVRHAAQTFRHDPFKDGGGSKFWWRGLRQRLLIVPLLFVAIAGPLLMSICMGVGILGALLTAPEEHRQKWFMVGLLVVIKILWSRSRENYRLYRRSNLRSAYDAVRADPRPPVLYLRDFATDRIRRWTNPFGRSTFEELLASSINWRLGPFIAIGDPGDEVSSFGAAKVYATDGTWKTTLNRYLRKAGCVLLVEGESGGLRHEIETVAEDKDRFRVFVATPPYRWRVNCWESFAKLLRESGLPVPLDDPGPGCLIGFDREGRVELLGKRMRFGLSFSRRMRCWLQKNVTQTPTTADPRPIEEVVARKKCETCGRLCLAIVEFCPNCRSRWEEPVPSGGEPG